MVEEPKRISRRKARADSKIKSKEDRYVEKHHQGSHKITKREFMMVLKKAATPISEWQHDSKDLGTSVAHPSDGCNDKCKSQDKIGDTKD